MSAPNSKRNSKSNMTAERSAAFLAGLRPEAQPNHDAFYMCWKDKRGLSPPRRLAEPSKQLEEGTMYGIPYYHAHMLRRMDRVPRRLKKHTHPMVVTTTEIGGSFKTPQLDFDTRCTGARSPPFEYNPLQDPHLKAYFSKPHRLRWLERIGKTTPDGKIICHTMKELTTYRRMLHEDYLDVLGRLREHMTEHMEDIMENRIENSLQMMNERYVKRRERYKKKQEMTKKAKRLENKKGKAAQKKSVTTREETTVVESESEQKMTSLLAKWEATEGATTTAGKRTDQDSKVGFKTSTPQQKTMTGRAHSEKGSKKEVKTKEKGKGAVGPGNALPRQSGRKSDVKSEVQGQESRASTEKLNTGLEAHPETSPRTEDGFSELQDTAGSYERKEDVHNRVELQMSPEHGQKDDVTGEADKDHHSIHNLPKERKTAFADQQDTRVPGKPSQKIRSGLPSTNSLGETNRKNSKSKKKPTKKTRPDVPIWERKCDSGTESASHLHSCVAGLTTLFEVEDVPELLRLMNHKHMPNKEREQRLLRLLLTKKSRVTGADAVPELDWYAHAHCSSFRWEALS